MHRELLQLQLRRTPVVCVVISVTARKKVAKFRSLRLRSSLTRRVDSFTNALDDGVNHETGKRWKGMQENKGSASAKYGCEEKLIEIVGTFISVGRSSLISDLS